MLTGMTWQDDQHKNEYWRHDCRREGFSMAESYCGKTCAQCGYRESAGCPDGYTRHGPGFGEHSEAGISLPLREAVPEDLPGIIRFPARTDCSVRAFLPLPPRRNKKEKPQQIVAFLLKGRCEEDARARLLSLTMITLRRR